MTINLTKGQTISLKKEVPNLTKLMCALGWDVADSPKKALGLFSYVPDYDLDASVFCLDSQDKLSHDKDVIYFGNLQHKSGAITHLGDNLTGAGKGDDEQIIIDLEKVPAEIVKLVFTVNIYSCLARKQDFSQIKNAFVRLVDMANQQEIARYDLSGEQYQGMTGMIMATVYRLDDSWQMSAIGEGVRINSLEELMRSYE